MCWYGPLIGNISLLCAWCRGLVLILCHRIQTLYQILPKYEWFVVINVSLFLKTQILCPYFELYKTCVQKKLETNKIMVSVIWHINKPAKGLLRNLKFSWIFNSKWLGVTIKINKLKKCFLYSVVIWNFHGCSVQRWF